MNEPAMEDDIAAAAPPLVTILINNYNYARFVGEAIESALAQTYPRCEVVVVDDGSTDNSRRIIESYGDRIVPVFKKNGGQASAYNAGFAKATGTIIMFLDSDDYLTPGAAERIVSLWTRGVEIVHHRLRIVDGDGKECGYWPDKALPLSSGNVVPELLEKGLYSAPASSGLAYGRSLLEKILPMPEEDFRICADAWLFLQAPFLAPVVALEESVACYRLHGSNNWGPGWPSRLISRERLLAFMTIRDRTHALIEKQASARGLSFNPLDWENTYTLRWKLILMRVGLYPSTDQVETALVRNIQEKIRASQLAPLRKVRENLLTLLIWKGPQFLLKPIFPNIF